MYEELLNRSRSVAILNRSSTLRLTPQLARRQYACISVTITSIRVTLSWKIR